VRSMAKPPESPFSSTDSCRYNYLVVYSDMEREHDGPRLQAWRRFLQAHAVVLDAIERDLAAANCLPPSACEVLAALAEAPNCRLRMHELARAVGLSRSGLTRLVDRLEAEGLLCRETCADDRRGAYATLTARGMATLERTWPIYTQHIAEHFGRHLTDATAAAMTEVLTQLVTAHDRSALQRLSTTADLREEERGEPSLPSYP
jgi:DNA-binding MarR family transcriptional regulator